VSRIKKLPPVFSATPEAFRAHADTINRLVDLVQPFGVVTLTASGTAGEIYGVYLCDCTSGAITLTLPPAASYKGKTLWVKKIDASGNAVTVDGDGSETIDNATTQTISVQYASLTLHCDGSEWWIL